MNRFSTTFTTTLMMLIEANRQARPCCRKRAMGTAVSASMPMMITSKSTSVECDGNPMPFAMDPEKPAPMSMNTNEEKRSAYAEVVKMEPSFSFVSETFS